MDVLRKELNSIYESQELDFESLDDNIVEECKKLASTCSNVDSDCRVITDAAADVCWVYGGSMADIIGLPWTSAFMDSSDEDEIYSRLHPEDLVDKRMLEYEFFKFVDTLPADKKLHHKATCRIRIKGSSGKYIYVGNSTQVLRLSPRGKMWLILCRYSLSPDQGKTHGIMPRIVNLHTGEIADVKISDRRTHLLTDREKQILTLIKEGYLSKEIADKLAISIHTVNRHRQNILEKLSVGNSLEAVMAASAMKLL